MSSHSKGHGRDILTKRHDLPLTIPKDPYLLRASHKLLHEMQQKHLPRHISESVPPSPLRGKLKLG